MPYKCFLFPLKRKLCTLSEPTQSAGEGTLIKEGITLTFFIQEMKMKTTGIQNVIRIQLCTSECEISLSHPALSFLTFTIALLTLGIFRWWQYLRIYSPFALLPFRHFSVISFLFYCCFGVPTKTLVWMLTTPLLKYCNIFCLASIFHFLPQIIFVLPWADTPPTMHMHTPFGSLLGPPLLFPSYSKLLVLPFMVLQTNSLWHLFLLLHTASICYQCFISSPFPPMSFMQNSENSSSQRKIWKRAVGITLLYLK